MSERTHAKKLLKWIIPMWVVNLIFFTVCLFMYNYANTFCLWYSGAFKTLSVTFGISKVILSGYLIYGVYELSTES